MTNKCAADFPITPNTKCSECGREPSEHCAKFDYVAARKNQNDYCSNYSYVNGYYFNFNAKS